jgi:hypothetical protein
VINNPCTKITKAYIYKKKLKNGMCISSKQTGEKTMHLELSYTTQALLQQGQQMGKAAQKKKHASKKQPDYRRRIPIAKDVTIANARSILLFFAFTTL